MPPNVSPRLSPPAVPRPAMTSQLIDSDQHQHRSPPFRAADAPHHPRRPDTPPPLPIPPPRNLPLFFPHDDDDDDDDEDEANMHASTVSTVAGHTRCPTLPSHPTRFESISRTIKSYTPQSASVIKDAIRSYVPSSIHYIPIPSAAPTPPMVSRPLSYGTFSVDQSADSLRPSCQQDMPFDDHYQRGGQDPFSERSTRTAIPPAVSSYPAGQLPHVDPISWARWDTVSDRRILIIGYTTGVQIWDCSDLGSVTEILNLTCESNEEWSHEHGGRPIHYTSFVHAAILPSPSLPRTTVFDYRQGDSLASHRPLLGILLTTPDSTLPSSSAFFIYSLNNHQIIHKISLSGIASTFESNNHLIVISTTSPATVHILSALTYRTLWTISSNSLAAFSPAPPNSVSLATRGQISSSSIEQPRASPPAPVFALSNRLLAYASPSPHSRNNDHHQHHHHLQSTMSSTSPPRSDRHLLSNAPSPFGFTQGDLGNAAIKVGGTVLSGMKFLGGIAYEAAKNKIGEGGGEVTSPISGGRRFFSRSAPTDGRPFTHTSLDDGRRSGEHDKDKVVTPHTNPVIESGYHVTVLDLQSLLLQDHQVIDGPSSPTQVAEFVTSRSQQVAKLAFSKDGCSLISAPENGQVVRVFRIRPMHSGDDKPGDAVRLYDLRRGRTSVLVEGLESSRDGRWVAIGTKNRTVHVFPTNPFGGRPDVAGHLQGKVKNVNELRLTLTEVAPLVRLRPKNAKVDQCAPLSFTFVHPGGVRVPINLLPQPSSKYVDTTSSPPMLSHRAHRLGNTQDLLVFDPSDGNLSLRRIVCDQRPHDQLGLVSVSTTARGVVSRSMPSAIGSAGATTRLSSSPSGATAVSRTSSSSTTPGGGSIPTTSGGQDAFMDLVGYDTTVATWNLQRRRNWEEIRKPISGVINTMRKRGFGADWLARAELSTCSRSPRVLPRSLYLAHQFTFWTLGEDYHALLRQYHFDVRGNKIHVRREVQISVGVGLNATSDRFVEDLGSMHPASSSFDEPLASALAGDLVTDYANSVPTVLPMYPNGISGAQSSLKAPAFIRNSIPIRRIGDGMSEGLGRIRREISSSYQRNKVHSPSLGPRRYGDDAMSVPLEFDEEDEDFLGVSRSVGNAGQGAIATTGISAESGTSGSAVDIAPPTPQAEDIWKGWESREVGQTVEEMEKFDDISVVGFLDEEHQKEVEEVKEKVRAERAVGIKARGKKGKKGKKIH